MDKLEGTFDNILEITKKMRAGRGTAGRLLTDDALAARLDDRAAAVHDLSVITASVTRGEGAIGSLTKKGGDAELAIADLRASAASLRKVTDRLETHEGLVGRLFSDDAYADRVAGDIRDAAANLAAITKKINEGQGTLGALVNDRTLYESAEDVVTGVNDSKFARWMLRHYQKKGIEAPPPPPAKAP